MTEQSNGNHNTNYQLNGAYQNLDPNTTIDFETPWGPLSSFKNTEETSSSEPASEPTAGEGTEGDGCDCACGEGLSPALTAIHTYEIWDDGGTPEFPDDDVLIGYAVTEFYGEPWGNTTIYDRDGNEVEPDENGEYPTQYNAQNSDWRLINEENIGTAVDALANGKPLAEVKEPEYQIPQVAAKNDSLSNKSEISEEEWKARGELWDNFTIHREYEGLATPKSLQEHINELKGLGEEKQADIYSNSLKVITNQDKIEQQEYIENKVANPHFFIRGLQNGVDGFNTTMEYTIIPFNNYVVSPITDAYMYENFGKPEDFEEYLEYVEVAYGKEKADELRQSGAYDPKYDPRRILVETAVGELATAGAFKAFQIGNKLVKGSELLDCARQIRFDPDQTRFGSGFGGLKFKIVPKGGYGSFSALKRALGPAGEGRHWHHIVEQSKVGQFGAEAIHHVDNVISIPAPIHHRITGFYNSIQDFTNGQTVRQWLNGQSFEFQREFGMDILRRFGAL